LVNNLKGEEIVLFDLMKAVQLALANGTSPEGLLVDEAYGLSAVLSPTSEVPLFLLVLCQSQDLQPAKTIIPNLPELKGQIKEDVLTRRMNKALRIRQVEFQHAAPKGTSSEAIVVFGALAKTLPCRWYLDANGKTEVNPTIVVLDEVYVCAPYTADYVRGTIRSSAMLVERVRKVLQLERARLSLKP